MHDTPNASHDRRVRLVCRRRHVTGFTLIELMITLAVIAVLASLALPAFQDSIRKARRSDGIVEISRVQQAEERWRANNATYSSDVSSAATGMRMSPATAATSDYDTAAGYYNVAVSGNTSTAYVITMSAKSGTSQTRDTNCQCMRVSWSGGNATYEAANSTTGSCSGASWASTNAPTCWKR